MNRRRPSRETPLGPRAKKDGCFRRLGIIICLIADADLYTIHKEMYTPVELYIRIQMKCSLNNSKIKR